MGWFWLLLLIHPASFATSIASNNQKMLDALQKVHGLSDGARKEIEAIFTASPRMGQGNPGPTKHPMSEAQCEAKLKKLKVSYEDPSFEKICQAKYMAPLYDPKTQKPEQAKACIDQFEFPNIPCTYPMVWTSARHAELICRSMGKRLCDAHEWESGCAGALVEDYPFSVVKKGMSPGQAFKAMRQAHNAKYSSQKSWAYGPSFQKGICAQASHKSAGCNGGNFQKCGTNTYPVGAFPQCKSPLKVYDLHGNAAEHMNLPLNPSQMTSKGSTTLGQTEMKGSWFIWDSFQAHPDWCRWRAPYWHGSAVMDQKSHENYHLGFRCCKSL